MATALVASAGRLKLLFQPQQECALATSATFAPGSNVGFNCQQDFIGIGERLPCHQDVYKRQHQGRAVRLHPPSVSVCTGTNMKPN